MPRLRRASKLVKIPFLSMLTYLIESNNPQIPRCRVVRRQPLFGGALLPRNSSLIFLTLGAPACCYMMTLRLVLSQVLWKEMLQYSYFCACCFRFKCIAPARACQNRASVSRSCCLFCFEETPYCHRTRHSFSSKTPPITSASLPDDDGFPLPGHADDDVRMEEAEFHD